MNSWCFALLPLRFRAFIREIYKSGYKTLLAFFLILDILKALPELDTVYDNLKNVGGIPSSRRKGDRTIAKSIVIKLIR